MVKKFFSSFAVMLLTLALNVEAQSFELHQLRASNVMYKSATKNVITSKIEPQDTESWYGYWDGTIDANLLTVGVQKVPKDYSVAICYPAGSAELSGKSINGIRFSFPDAKNIKNVKIWMSTVAPLTPDEADITVQEVKNVTDFKNNSDPFNEIRFDKPYKFDSTKDFFVGYSFTVSDGNGEAEQYPILTYVNKDKPNALWLQAGTAAKWMDYNGYGFGAAALQILVDGSFKDDAATIHSALGTYSSLSSKDITIPVIIENAGANGVTDLGLKITLNGEVSNINIKPEAPIKGIGTEYSFDITVKAPAEPGNYNLDVCIDKVNGLDNQLEALANAKIYVVSKAGKKKPFIEEFTAFWCGYCPRGIIGMEKLRKMYRDDVVIATIHIADELDGSKDYAELVNTIGGYPSAHVDRDFKDVDPYYGNSGPFGISDLVEKCIQNLPVADVNVRAALNGNTLTATSDVEFFFTGSASEFDVCYIVTENDMSDEKWLQSNYFSGSKEGLEIEEPMFEPWVNGEKKIAGIVYNDVFVAAKGITEGVAESIPEEVKEGEKNSYSVDFDLSEYSVIRDRSKLYVAAVIFNKITGKAVNANFVHLDVNSGIDNVNGTDCVETARYLLDGTKVSNPVKGVNIVKYSDGSVRKIYVR